VGVRPGVDGRALDPAASADRVVAALLARAIPGSGLPVVEPAVTVTRPALTTEQASAVAPTRSRISSWTTSYSISERNGFGANIEVPARLIDGTVIAPGITTRATPGHTPGSMCFQLEGTPLLFSGDTLFPGGPGNTSFEGGDFPTIIEAIDRRLFTRPADTLVLPGHGNWTTIGAERPHLQEWVDRGW
jgi:glyoxylase-like metal-dependent hydrolase (beta-lactamase superfamily II)